MQWNETIKLFRGGMPLRRHWAHFRYYDWSFTGSEAVDYLHELLRRNHNFGPEVTRYQTLQLLKKFLKAHVIEDIKGRHGTEDFEDNSHLYRYFLWSCAVLCCWLQRHCCCTLTVGPVSFQLSPVLLSLCPGSPHCLPSSLFQRGLCWETAVTCPDSFAGMTTKNYHSGKTFPRWSLLSWWERDKRVSAPPLIALTHAVWEVK